MSGGKGRRKEKDLGGLSGRPLKQTVGGRRGSVNRAIYGRKKEVNLHWWGNLRKAWKKNLLQCHHVRGARSCSGQFAGCARERIQNHRRSVTLSRGGGGKGTRIKRSWR